MKIQYITEGTTENMSIIRDITKLVLSNVPEIIPEETTVNLDANKIKPTKIAPYSFDDLKKKYENKDHIIQSLQEITYIFANYNSNVNVKIYGEYHDVFNAIVINVSGIAKKTGDIKKSELLDEKNNSFALIPVMFHEIRHAFQKAHYYWHFTGKGRSGDYRKRDIEIDAKWHDVLETYDLKHFKNAKAYATAVMNELKDQRDLTQKQEKHYWYKTINYYLNPDVKEPEKSSKEKYEEYITKKIPNMVSEKIIENQKLLNDFDLRNLPGYQSDSFLLPLRNIIPKLYKILNGEASNNELQKNMLYLVAAIMFPGNSRILKDFKKYMIKVHGYTPDQAIASIDFGLKKPEGYTPFDFDSIRNFLKSQY